MAEFGTIGTARVAVKVDLSGLRRQLAGAVKTSQASLAGIQPGRLNNQFRQFGNNASRSFRDASAGASRFRANLLDIRAILPTLTAGFAIKSFFEFGDTAIRLRNRVRLVTDSSEEFQQVQQKLFNISQSTRTELEATTRLYSRLRLFTDEATFSSDQLFRVTESIGKAFRISGAQAREAAGATIQFTQGIGSNKLGGEELRSVLEQGQRLAQGLADGLNETGIAFEALGRKATVGDLKTLNEKGLLTAKNVIGAILTQSAQFDSEFSKVEKSISDAFTLLNNQLLRSIGLIDDGTGATKALIGAIDGIREAVAGAGFRAAFTALSEGIAFALRNADLLAAALTVLVAGRIGQGIGNLISRFREKAVVMGEARRAAVASAAAEQRAAAAAAASAQSQLLAAQAAARTAKGRLAVATATRNVSIAQAQATATTNALAASQARLSVAMAATTVRAGLLRGAMAFFGGPIGLAIAGVTTGIILLGNAMANASINARTLEGAVEAFLKTTEGGPSIQKTGEGLIERLDEQIAETRNKLEQLQRTSRETGQAVEEGLVNVPFGFGALFRDTSKDERGLIERSAADIAKVEANLKRLESLRKRVATALKATGDVPGVDPEKVGDLAGDAEKASNAIGDLIRKSQEAVAVARTEGLERERLKAAISLEAAERRDNRKATDIEKAALDEAITTLFQEEEARKRVADAQERQKKMREDLQSIFAEQRATRELIEALKESEQEYKIVAEQQKILNQVQGIGKERARELAEENVALADELDNLKDKTNPLAEAFQDLGSTFSSALEDAVIEAKELSEVLDALFKDIFRIAFRKLATEPLFGGLAKAFETGDFSGNLQKAAQTSVLGKGGSILFPTPAPTTTAPVTTDLTIEDAKRARATGTALDNLNTAGKEATTTITNMAGATASTSQVLTGTLAAGAIETGVAEKAKSTVLTQATSGVIEFTAALRLATAALNSLGGGAGGGAGGGGGKLASLFTSTGGFGGSVGSFGDLINRGFTGRAEGGLVVGPGTGKSDSILSALSNGEFVVNAQATRANLPALDALNRSGSLPVGDMVFHIDGSGSDPEAIAAEIATIINRSQFMTPRQSTRAAVRNFRRAKGDGF